MGRLDADHGAKDFFAVDAHLGRGFGEQGGAQVEAGGAVGIGSERFAAVQRGAFLLADGDLLQVLRQLAVIYYGADVGAGLAGTRVTCGKQCRCAVELQLLQAIGIRLGRKAQFAVEFGQRNGQQAGLQYAFEVLWGNVQALLGESTG